MPIKLSSSTNALFVARGIAKRLIGAQSPGASSILTGGSISIWGGAQPTAENFITNWIASYRTTILLHYDNRNFECPQIVNGTAGQGPATLANSGVWSSVFSTGNGTATWGVLWLGGNQVSTILSTSALPTTSFVILPVSDLAGQGVIKFTNTSVTVGQAVQIASFNLTISN